MTVEIMKRYVEDYIFRKKGVRVQITIGDSNRELMMLEHCYNYALTQI